MSLALVSTSCHEQPESAMKSPARIMAQTWIIALWFFLCAQQGIVAENLVRCRLRRSVTQTDDTHEHDNISLHIHLLGSAGREIDVVDLNLTKSKANIIEVPVILGQQKAFDFNYDNKLNKKLVLYTNNESTAEILTTEKSTHHQYFGTFRASDGQDYVLTPTKSKALERNEDSVGNKHSRARRDAEESQADPEGEKSEGADLEGDISEGLDDEDNGEDYVASPTNDTSVNITDFGGRKTFQKESPHESEIMDLHEAEEEQERGGETITRREYTAELLIAVDYAIYRKWYSMSSSPYRDGKKREAIQNIYQYYSFVAFEINRKFVAMHTDNLTLEINVSGIYIATTPGDSQWTETVRELDPESGAYITHAYKSLDLFEDWLEENEDQLPAMDVSALFTGYVPYTRASGGRISPISGVADVGGMCTKRRASLNRDKGLYGVTMTAAHEIGHLLGSPHDGAGNDCDAYDQYIMAPIPRNVGAERLSNQYRFSTCSINTIRTHLDYLTVLSANCLLSSGRSTMNQTELERRLRIPAGQFYDTDKQCRALLGPTSYYCGGDVNDKQMCQKLYCYNALLDQCMWSKPEDRAANGTTCGHRKWCDHGFCVSNDLAPPARDYCLSGDFRGLIADGVKCTDVKRYKRHLCYNENYRRQCCQTCMDVKDESQPDCPYGDQTDWCQTISRTDCYYDTTRTKCCKRCKTMEISYLPDTCRYGDKASWCSRIRRGQCYDSDSTCCENCRRHRIGPPGCEYGNKANWCNRPNLCYVERDRAECCLYCSYYWKGVKGCEYGDHIRYCRYSDCTDPVNKFKCCWTCRSYIRDAVTITTTTPYPEGTTKAKDLQTVTERSTDCVDELPSCNFLISRECYKKRSVCCNSCKNMRTSIQGCEFGDREPWCKFLILTEDDCTGQDLTDCCQTCREILQSTTTNKYVPGDNPEISMSSTKASLEGSMKSSTQQTSSSTTTTSPSTAATSKTISLNTAHQISSATQTNSKWNSSMAASQKDSTVDPSSTFSSSSSSESTTTTTTTTTPATTTSKPMTTTSTKTTPATTTMPETKTTPEPTTVPTTTTPTTTAPSTTTTPTTTISKTATSSITTPTTTTTEEPLVWREDCQGNIWYNFCYEMSRKRCYSERVYKHCCRTCQEFRLGIGGCDYGNRENYCPDPNDLEATLALNCADPWYMKRCCLSCYKKRTYLLQNCTQVDSDYCSGVLNHHCHAEHIQEDCCHTCQGKLVPVMGCEFGDKATWCENIQKRNCYNEGTRDTCCHTCYQHEITLLDCRYGDREGGDYCSARYTYRCYDPSFRRSCCSMCAAQEAKIDMYWCKYGDRIPGCTRDTCSPYNRNQCCHTCRSM